MSLSINSSETVATLQEINLKKWQKNELRIKVTEVHGKRVLEVEKTLITKKRKNKDIPKLVKLLNEVLPKLSELPNGSFETNCNIFHGEVFEYNKFHRNDPLRFANPFKKTMKVKIKYPWLEEGEKIIKTITYSRRFVHGRTTFKKILNSLHKKLEEENIYPEAARGKQGTKMYAFICERVSEEAKISDEMEHESTIKLNYDNIDLEQILLNASKLSYKDGYRDATTEFNPNNKLFGLIDALNTKKEKILSKKAPNEKLPVKGRLIVKIQHIWLSCTKDQPSETFFKELNICISYSKATTFEDVLNKIDATLKKHLLSMQFLKEPENENYTKICKLAEKKTTITGWMKSQSKKSEMLDSSNTILLKFNNINLESAIEAVRKPYEEGFTNGLSKIKTVKNNGKLLKIA